MRGGDLHAIEFDRRGLRPGEAGARLVSAIRDFEAGMPTMVACPREATVDQAGTGAFDFEPRGGMPDNTSATGAACPIR